MSRLGILPITCRLELLCCWVLLIAACPRPVSRWSNVTVVVSCFMGYEAYEGAILVRVRHCGTTRGALALATHTSPFYIYARYVILYFNQKTAHPLFAFPNKKK